MGQFGVMIGQLVGFLIMLMVGYGCVRLRFYGQTALDGMCSLLLNVLIPVLVFEVPHLRMSAKSAVVPHRF